MTQMFVEKDKDEVPPPLMHKKKSLVLNQWSNVVRFAWIFTADMPFDCICLSSRVNSAQGGKNGHALLTQSALHNARSHLCHHFKFFQYSK